jgi:hypothetical protein
MLNLGKSQLIPAGFSLPRRQSGEHLECFQAAFVLVECVDWKQCVGRN